MELLRKQSDPPMLASKQRLMGFNSLAITVPSFSTGNASEDKEPLSAHSFAAQGTPQLGKQDLRPANEEEDKDSPDDATPTLPCRADSSSDLERSFTDLDRELLSQSPDHGVINASP